MATVNPSRLILLGARPQPEKARDFLTRLASLVKYAINRKGGVVSVDTLAAALGERERSVQVGLQALRALGKLDYHVGASGEYRLEWADNAPGSQLQALQKRLRLLLRETRAYRNYWLTMKIQE